MSSADPVSPEAVTDPDGATGMLVNWLVQTSLDDVPEPVVDRGKILVLDGLACGLQLLHAVVGTSRASRLGDGGGYRRRWRVGLGSKAPAPVAALLNGTFVQGFELDDYHSFGPLHSESCVLPSVIAAAESLSGVDGRRLLEACVLGFEVGPRVGIAIGGPRADQ